MRPAVLALGAKPALVTLTISKGQTFGQVVSRRFGVTPEQQPVAAVRECLNLAVMVDDNYLGRPTTTNLAG